MATKSRSNARKTKRKSKTAVTLKNLMIPNGNLNKVTKQLGFFLQKMVIRLRNITFIIMLVKNPGIMCPKK